MEIQGKIIQILPLQSGVGKASGKEWKKQDYILETIDSFPKKICFNLWGDAIDRAQLQVGEEVTVQVDVESREFNGRWYTDVKGWRVDRGFVSLAAPSMGTTTQAPPAPPSYIPPQQPLGGHDPFAGAATIPSSSAGVAPAVGDDLPF
ncbi:MAG: DUF3127 domain-containing protein [Porphyromonadaceae bacterium]|nr:DUF3127 domain-containing protein [Porphyromonadaceae bacterium]